MTVDFTCACPDCGHNLVVVANSGSPYDWDWDTCPCQSRRYKKRN